MSNTNNREQIDTLDKSKDTPLKKKRTLIFHNKNSFYTKVSLTGKNSTF